MDNFPHFYTKSYVVGTCYNCPDEVILTSAHNICFSGDIREIIKGPSYNYYFCSLTFCHLKEVVAIMISNMDQYDR